MPAIPRPPSPGTTQGGLTTDLGAIRKRLAAFGLSADAPTLLRPRLIVASARPGLAYAQVGSPPPLRLRLHCNNAAPDTCPPTAPDG
jgi:hypothetical protein